ncbi:MAG: rhomboid family intramembrane serine protease, partial [Muribaculaceae bacterium]|nr:rhomboid family intramembrane serine protease [Muribaculaceae bacterium]
MAGINIDNCFRPRAARPWWSRCFSSMLAGIVTVNVLIFLIVSGTDALARFNLAPWLGMLGPAEVWIKRPWGLLTYMFVQTDLIHLLFNMVWLWGFGTLMTRFDGPRTLLRTYLAGGIGGAVCFLILTTVLEVKGVSMLVGSSAAVMGIIAGAAARQPRVRVGLVFFGDVELRVIALIAIVLLGIVPGIGSLPTLTA